MDIVNAWLADTSTDNDDHHVEPALPIVKHGDNVKDDLVAATAL